MKKALLSTLALATYLYAVAQQNTLPADVCNALNFRSIGPAVTSGRVIDIAIHPRNKNTWYIAAASGGVFKTVNAGTTFTPIFDGQGSYSIGCLAIDPNNPNVVWVGTGENNNQRSVAYGDGVYKSEDGGKTWKNMGLPNSEHIGSIAIDPNNSNHVLVAAYGPLWSSGGDRGIYESKDGGNTWKRTLFVSENTGCNEVWFNPSLPNIVYAAAHQRRRHEWTYLSGGPEGGFYRSSDGGATFTKVTNGLPAGDVGRVAIALPPTEPDWVYAMVEAKDESGGLYRSTDRGASFKKMGNHRTSGNYYMEIMADPTDALTLYSMDTWAQVSKDGGKTFKGLGEKDKHVDNHALWVNPSNNQHLIIGCDGGLYESFDGAATWNFKANLPITQFYRICTDNAKPFYNIYGGTQDNNTLGGPSRTLSASGITNADWFVTVGGDGFQSRVDPKDPNTVYSQWQYGGLIRFNRVTGEATDIKPREQAGEAAYRYNWDAPLVISAFNNKRIYFAANKVFRSNNKGNEWEVISGDLTRGVDRNKLPVMGQVQSIDAIGKNESTSIYGNITALAESPLNENTLYAGTDDGLIQVTNDGGKTWNKGKLPAEVPQITLNGITTGPLVNYLLSSKHNASVAYAIVNNHRMGDFKPYVLKTTDAGKTWFAIQGNLPNRGSAYSIAEDHKDPNLLFCGTEFGLYVSNNGGKNWQELSNGLPSAVCIKDIAIQERENDLVIATFGRGIYVLDDYSMLRNAAAFPVKEKAKVFPVKPALVYNESTPYGHKGRSFQGASFFVAPNPAVGAKIWWYLNDTVASIKDQRKAREKAAKDKYYPSKDSITLEDLEVPAQIFLLITDAIGVEVKRIKESGSKGLKTTFWNGRYNATSPVSFDKPDPDNPYDDEPLGMPALPGTYYATLVKVSTKGVDTLSTPQAFELLSMFSQQTEQELLPSAKAYFYELAETRRMILGSAQYLEELKNRLSYVKQGLSEIATPQSLNLLSLAMNLELWTKKLSQEFYGNGSLARREFETLPGLSGRVENLVYGSWATTEGFTQSRQADLKVLNNDFVAAYARLQELDKQVLTLLESCNKVGLPFTPGKLPVPR